MNSSQRGPDTILVCDDDEGILELIQLFFKPHKYYMLTAADGIEAVKTSDNHKGPIRLLLTDVQMPRMTGPEAAQYISVRRPNIRILFMSGFDIDVLQEEANSIRDFAMDPSSSHLVRGFIKKPFTSEDLTNKIDKILGE